MEKLEDKYLKLLGSRILSELNDLKRTVESASSELDLTVTKLQAAVEGQLTTQEVMEILFKLGQTYPIDISEILLVESDCTNGVKVCKASESKKSRRVFARSNRDNELTPYYEYRDTAMSNTSMFRPEWIEQLRVVKDCDPLNPDVVYNNGHLMHQVTFFIGPVNFYYEVEGIKYCQEMNTGDSNYITPFVKHSFASRDENEQALIIACTFGGEAKRAQKEMYNLGSEGVENFLLPKVNTNDATKSLILQHLENENMNAEILQSKIQKQNIDLDLNTLLSPDGDISYSQLCKLSKLINVEVYDLMVSQNAIDDQVIMTKSNLDNIYCYPQFQKTQYRIQPLVRTSRLANVKSFDIEVLAQSYSAKLLWQSTLHQYVYNYGDCSVDLFWSYGSESYTSTIEAGDSCYLQPNLPHCFVNSSSARGRLINIRIPGAINLDVQREISAFADLERITSETKSWFNPKGS